MGVGVAVCGCQRENLTGFAVFSATRTSRIDFKFYDLLEQILDKQPSTSASALEADAIEISEDSEGDGGNDGGESSFKVTRLIHY